jgi:hypothetical protein
LNLCPIGIPIIIQNLLVTSPPTLKFAMSSWGRMEDLEEKITCHREALALRPHGHPDHLSSLGKLANAVFTRSEQLEPIK